MYRAESDSGFCGPMKREHWCATVGASIVNTNIMVPYIPNIALVSDTLCHPKGVSADLLGSRKGTLKKKRYLRHT